MDNKKDRGVWAWYRLSVEERQEIHKQYHLNKINEALTNLRGHYWIPKKGEIK
jgi:hypothetical protein